MPLTSNLQVVIIIPARMKSTRFPGKPLALINDKSMIFRVWEQCVKALDQKSVYVATDNEEIASHCLALGIKSLLTSESCLTGTDRVYEASLQVDADIYINVQGDEPLIDPGDITAVIECARKNPQSIINAMCPISSEEEFYNSTVPKVVARPDGKLLYMSRSAIPTNKTLEFQTANKQVCIYAFPIKALKAFYDYGKKTPLEAIEDIEILRFIEMNIEVTMLPVSTASIAVDVPDDIKKVESALNNA